MAMLNFKHGLYGNLFNTDGTEKVAINNGTIYVTTDEKAMYVDLNNERIRLSQIITCTFSQWQQLTPPFSTEAFYYIIDKNALLKYNEAKKDNDNVDPEHNEGYTEGWVQINSTAALTAALESLEARVKAIEDQNYSGKIASINEQITGLGNKDKALEDSIKALQNADTAIESNIDNIENLLNYKGKVDSVPTSGVALGDVYLVGEEYKRCTKIGTNGALTWETYAGIGDDLFKLREQTKSFATNSAVVELSTKVDTLSETVNGTGDGSSGLVNKVSKLEGSVFKNGEDQIAINANAISNIKKEIGTPGTAATGLYKQISDINSDLSAYKVANNTAVETAQKKADDAYDLAGEKTTMAEVQGWVNGLNHATKGELNAVLGDDNSKPEDKSVYGVSKALGAYQAANDQVISGIKNGETINSFNQVEKKFKDITDNYATKTEAQGYASVVLGKNGDASTANTVYGAKQAAAEAKAAGEAAKTYAETIVLGDAQDTANDTTVYGAFAAIKDLEDDLNSKMSVADAMVFKGTIEDGAKLPKSAENGWTYKATKEFVIGTGDSATYVYIGDLLIAADAEDETEGITWKHVPSGYVADYNPEMTLVKPDGSTDRAVIKLTSGVSKDDGKTGNDGDLGQFIIAAEAQSAVKINVTGNDTVSISMEWGSF